MMKLMVTIHNLETCLKTQFTVIECF